MVLACIAYHFLAENGEVPEGRSKGRLGRRLGMAAGIAGDLDSKSLVSMPPSGSLIVELSMVSGVWGFARPACPCSWVRVLKSEEGAGHG